MKRLTDPFFKFVGWWKEQGFESDIKMYIDVDDYMNLSTALYVEDQFQTIDIQMYDHLNIAGIKIYPNLNPKFIKEAKEKGFQEGYLKKTNEIKKALGIIN